LWHPQQRTKCASLGTPATLRPAAARNRIFLSPVPVPRGFPYPPLEPNKRDQFVPKMKITNANKPILKAIPTSRLLPWPKQESINVITEQSAAAINRSTNIPARPAKYCPTDHVLKLASRRPKAIATMPNIVTAAIAPIGPALARNPFLLTRSVTAISFLRSKTVSIPALSQNRRKERGTHSVEGVSSS
jgi:hypothetical protein